MKWIYHHDQGGIPDYPEALPFKICIEHYWTSDEDIRIGYFGRAKGATTFTYRNRDINFRFTILRSFAGKPWRKEDEYFGEACVLYIDDMLPKNLDSEDIISLMDSIKSFLYIYKNPRYPEEAQITTISIPLAEKYLKSTRDQSNA